MERPDFFASGPRQLGETIYSITLVRLRSVFPALSPKLPYDGSVLCKQNLTHVRPCMFGLCFVGLHYFTPLKGSGETRI